jgi:fumarate reductase (CoM/CoB) subunit B
MENNKTNTKNEVNNHDCSPLNGLYCNLKLRITGSLNQQDLENLYNCNLCNHCHLAGVNQGAREKAVNKKTIAHHLAEISQNIRKSGNSYGVLQIKNSDQRKMETVLFKGCTPTHKTPEILRSPENLLKQEGIPYGVISDETCCGNILFNLGDSATGWEAVERNIRKFKRAGVKKIITICPGCYNAFQKYYKGQNGFDPEIILAVELLTESKLPGEYVIQDPCHAREKSDLVREIIPNAHNKSASPCCGAGGGVMAHNKLLATSKAIKTLKDCKSPLVTYCPFCYLNLSAVNPQATADIYMLLEEQYVTREKLNHEKPIPYPI